MRAALALAALLAAGAPALACTCLQRTDAEIVEAADVVVVGRITDVKPGGEPNAGTLTATVEVLRIVKGRVHRQIQVTTRDNAAACGLPLRVGATVRLAANKLNDGLHTNICMALKT